MKKTTLISACILILALSSGCVTGRRSFDLAVKTAPMGAAKGEVAIGTITDEREFENKPSSPSTPSIDGDVHSLTEAEKSTFIGRQRGGFGKAFGDIVLPSGMTVQAKVAELLGEGLKRRGYKVHPGSGDLVIDAQIDQFWAWMNPGFATLTFEAEIKCKITVTRGGKPTVFHVRGFGRNLGQFAKDVNWQQTYERAFDDFLANLADQLADAGL